LVPKEGRVNPVQPDCSRQKKPSISFDRFIIY
jgi:hypothetical protein